ncbi:MAG: serine hydrolase [Planctomycetota bacterium]|nr:serine hydrolase [Planctomycetota bacterium]
MNRESLLTSLGLGLMTSAAGTPLALGDAFDLDEVTRLARGSLVGQNVDRAVPGFELLLMRDGVTIYRQAFGSFQLDQVANADSATKTLSGALMMSLTENSPQAFSLDTRLSQFIPQFSGAKSTITIRQAFSHTAGLGATSAEGNPSVDLQGAALIIASAPLAFAPGTTFLYGGSSMHAAGAVAELAGGQPWNTLFAQRITGPLGMSSTRFVLTTPTNPRIAGGCESRATEFARFMECLRRGGEIDGVRILQPTSVQQMFTRQTPVGVPIAGTPYKESSDYGVGVWLDRNAQGVVNAAVAAGARGFYSWIDFDDRVVGAFATDLTRSGNIIGLLDLVRAATEQAVRKPALPGDANRDGTLDRLDLDALAAFFGDSGVLWSQGDFTGDGLANTTDLDVVRQSYDPESFEADWQWATNRAACAADFNGDAQADFFDFLDFTEAYAARGPLADVDRDGAVDFFDYLAYAIAFDAGCGS